MRFYWKVVTKGGFILRSTWYRLINEVARNSWVSAELSKIKYKLSVDVQIGGPNS